MVQLHQLALIAAAFLSTTTLSAVPADRLVERQGACSTEVQVYIQFKTVWVTSRIQTNVETSVPTRTSLVQTITTPTSTYTTVLPTSSPTSYTTVLPTSVLSSYTTNATLSTWVLSYYTTPTVLPTYVPTSITTIIHTSVPTNYTTVITNSDPWETNELETLYRTYTQVAQSTISFKSLSTITSITTTCVPYSQSTSTPDPAPH
ncbi:hypothetical protein N431DRAFT_473027 [Stipitochalara longipes BDJ]|nr:hypothetical protein N431DRAFT_473027 [Stipitochalara longipes BDJ]